MAPGAILTCGEGDGGRVTMARPTTANLVAEEPPQKALENKPNIGLTRPNDPNRSLREPTTLVFL